MSSTTTNARNNGDIDPQGQEHVIQEADEQPSIVDNKKKRPNENVVVAQNNSNNKADDAPPTKIPKQTAIAAASSSSAPPSKKKKQRDPNVLRIRREIQQCCKNNDLARAWTFYQEAKTTPIRLEAQSYYNLLNLCDGLEPSLHIGTPKKPTTTTTTENKSSTSKEGENDGVKQQEEQQKQKVELVVDLPTRRAYAEQLRQDMVKLSLPLTEPAYTALIRLYCKVSQTSTADLEKAAALLQEAEGISQCKKRLRLYSGLLGAYCDDCNNNNNNSNALLNKALDLWKRLDSFEIHLGEREYASLLGAATRTKCFWLVRRVLSELSEDGLVPSKATTKGILDWFQSDAARSEEDAVVTLETAAPTSTVEVEQKERSTTTINSTLNDPSLAPTSDTELLGSVVMPQGWTIHSNVTIDTSTGTLKLPPNNNNGTSVAAPHPPLVLQPVKVPDHAWNDLQTYNSTIVIQGELDSSSPFQGGGKGPKRQGINLKERQVHWKRFQTWLEQQQQQQKQWMTTTTTTNNDASTTTITFVLDGANIGYYKQNFSGAPKHVCYEQIDLVIQKLLTGRYNNNNNKNNNNSNNIRVMLMLHERHFLPRVVPKSARSIIHRWTRGSSSNFVLYKTPFGCNDDWFWVGAALAFGTRNSGTTNHHHTCCYVVTNDEMRDHHFQMLSSSARNLLSKWKERHQVHFEIFGGTSCSFQFPAPYSRRIQHVVAMMDDDKNNNKTSTISKVGSGDGCAWIIPMPKHGDENRFLDGSHVANEEDVPKEEMYTCIVANKEERKKRIDREK